MEQLAELVGNSDVGPMGLLVLQPTPYCNLDCSYCYLLHRNDRSRMSDETLEWIGSRAIASPIAAEPLSVVWHGGEPMTLPPSWYEAAFRRLQRASGGRRINHSFQTNAIGTNDAWISLWQRHKVRLGISIDGPEYVHDARRVSRNGRGSFALSLKSARRIQDSGLSFHLISVLTRESLDRPDEMFDFYVSHGFRDVCFNVEEEEGAHRCSSLREQGTEAAYRFFLDRFFARVLAERTPFRCRELDSVRWLALASTSERMVNQQIRPLQIVTIGVDGSMSTYSPEWIGAHAPEYDNFRFGNVHQSGPEEILNHPAFLRLRLDIEAGVSACRSECVHFGVCGGGAPANKFFEHRSVRTTETLFCRLTRKVALEAALSALEGHENVA